MALRSLARPKAVSKAFLPYVVLAFCVAAFLPTACLGAQSAWNLNVLSSVQGTAVRVYTGPNFSGRNIAGFAWESQNTEHVFYIGTDQHIHELYHDKVWHHNDLTLASGDTGTPQGHLAAYVSEKAGTEHVFYVGRQPERDANGFAAHIHELYYESGKWHAHDLNVAVPDAALPDPDGASLSGFVFQKQNTQHLFYVGLGEDMHELYYDGAWHYNDLSRATGSAGTVAGRGIAAFVTAYDNTEHVICFLNLGGELSLGEYWWNGTWHLNQGVQTDSSGAWPAPRGGIIAGYSWESRQSEHVIYIDRSNSHITELYHDQLTGGPWARSDLSSAVGPQNAFLPTGALTGYAFERDGTEHVIYVGPSPEGPASPDLWELYGDGSGWHVGGITHQGIPSGLIGQFSNSPAFGGVSPSTHLVGFSQERDKTEHIFFVSGTGLLCELYHTP